MERVNIVTDKKRDFREASHSWKMSTAGEADKASAALTVTTLGGRTLKVNEARDKAY